MVFTLFKVAVAIGAFFCIYLTGTFIVRSFTHQRYTPANGLSFPGAPPDPRASRSASRRSARC